MSKRRIATRACATIEPGPKTENPSAEPPDDGCGDSMPALLQILNLDEDRRERLAKPHPPAIRAGLKVRALQQRGKNAAQNPVNVCE